MFNTSQDVKTASDFLLSDVLFTIIEHFQRSNFTYEVFVATPTTLSHSKF